ncbi:hypothetical protein GEMRC1_011724 [Eukaryota sp. GEM-RC1]
MVRLVAICLFLLFVCSSASNICLLSTCTGVCYTSSWLILASENPSSLCPDDDGGGDPVLMSTILSTECSTTFDSVALKAFDITLPVDHFRVKDILLICQSVATLTLETQGSISSIVEVEFGAFGKDFSLDQPHQLSGSSLTLQTSSSLDLHVNVAHPISVHLSLIILGTLRLYNQGTIQMSIFELTVDNLIWESGSIPGNCLTIQNKLTVSHSVSMPAGITFGEGAQIEISDGAVLTFTSDLNPRDYDGLEFLVKGTVRLPSFFDSSATTRLQGGTIECLDDQCDLYLSESTGSLKGNIKIKNIEFVDSDPIYLLDDTLLHLECESISGFNVLCESNCEIRSGVVHFDQFVNIVGEDSHGMIIFNVNSDATFTLEEEPDSFIPNVVVNDAVLRVDVGILHVGELFLKLERYLALLSKLRIILKSPPLTVFHLSH